jgi:predicted Zn-dependent protease
MADMSCDVALHLRFLVIGLAAALALQSSLPARAFQASCDVTSPDLAAVHERHMRALNASVEREPLPTPRAQALFDRILLANGLQGRGYVLRAYAARGFNASAIHPRGVALSLEAMADSVSDADIASVLSHEIAHLEMDHAAEQACEQRRLAPSPLGFQDSAREFEREAVDNPVFAATFTRISQRQEIEADGQALDYMRAAGFEPMSVARMLARHVVENPMNGSHPTLAERLSALALALTPDPSRP